MCMISDYYSIYVSLLTKGKEYILLKETKYNALSFRICIICILVTLYAHSIYLSYIS